MHEALGTQESGLVRFSFSYFNTIEEVKETSAALHEIAQSM
jgi:selenocysteine lyase/cysteine desulfurase